MKIVNTTDCHIQDSQFDAIRISRYFRNRIDGLLFPIHQCVNPARITDDHIQRLVSLVIELDRLNSGKVAISFAILPALRMRIARAFLVKGYDTYHVSLDGKDCVWIDPR